MLLVFGANIVEIVYSNTLHLMESGIMSTVNCIFPIDISDAKECIVSRLLH